jgi:hypothetical protein
VKAKLHTHAAARFDALYAEAIDLYRRSNKIFAVKPAPTHSRIDRFDEHSVELMSRVLAQNRRTPFDIEAGSKIEARRRPPTFKPASRQICIAHEAGESPC